MPLKSISGGSGEPQEPDWESIYSDVLDQAAAHDEWGVAIRELRDAGTLAVANAHAVKRMVELRIQYERAAKHVAEHGAILPAKGAEGSAKHAQIGQHNPYWSVMLRSDEALRQHEAELGIAPARRNKAAKVKREKKTARAADAYLRPLNAK